MKKKLKLSNVTLLAATSSEMDAAQISMRISLHNIKFGADRNKEKLLALYPYANNLNILLTLKVENPHCWSNFNLAIYGLLM